MDICSLFLTFFIISLCGSCFFCLFCLLFLTKLGLITYLCNSWLQIRDLPPESQEPTLCSPTGACRKTRGDSSPTLLPPTSYHLPEHRAQGAVLIALQPSSPKKLSHLGPPEKLTTFCVTQYINESSILMSGMYCHKDPRKPTWLHALDIFWGDTGFPAETVSMAVNV